MLRGGPQLKLRLFVIEAREAAVVGIPQRRDASNRRGRASVHLPARYQAKKS